jgi:DNA-binding Lrp family transcriptional regulator
MQPLGRIGWRLDPCVVIKTTIFPAGKHKWPRTRRLCPRRMHPRGIEKLRAFRPCVDTLGNGEISERTGLPRSTVSQLTRTLVNSGILDEVRTDRTYRLAASPARSVHTSTLLLPNAKRRWQAVKAVSEGQTRSGRGSTYLVSSFFSNIRFARASSISIVTRSSERCHRLFAEVLEAATSVLRPTWMPHKL